MYASATVNTYVFTLWFNLKGLHAFSSFPVLTLALMEISSDRTIQQRSSLASLVQLVRALHRKRKAAVSVPARWPMVAFLATIPAWLGLILYENFVWKSHLQKSYLPNFCSHCDCVFLFFPQGVKKVSQEIQTSPENNVNQVRMYTL